MKRLFEVRRIVERRDTAFIDALLAACTLSRLKLSFECINFFEKEQKSQRSLSRSTSAF
jgi:hypothetical protein